MNPNLVNPWYAIKGPYLETGIEGGELLGISEFLIFPGLKDLMLNIIHFLNKILDIPPCSNIWII